MSTPNDALSQEPAQVRALLKRLHEASRTQEAPLTKSDYAHDVIHDRMRDKFIALDEDKAQFMYQVCRATNAKTIVEAGTSFGVSTIYLALAAGANARATGGTARVIATEHEPTKAARAREHWAECGREVADVIDLREGDLRETLKEGLEEVDLLLLDIWGPMILPTLKVVEPKFRHGAVIISDNTIGSAESYKDFFNHIRRPGSGYITSTLPFAKGLEMSIYLPGKS